jgi:predicted DsbA family dithiol-disulfide isomerase
MHAAIYHAYFLEGRDIGRIDVLVAIGTSVGLDATDLRVELDVDRWTERVEADEAEAAALGITGVPAFAREAERDGEQRLEVVLGVRDHAWLLRWVDAGSGLEGGR